MISEDDPLAALAQAVDFAHQHLHDGVRLDPRRDGMSTTLTAVLGNGERFGLAHVGDSRAYLCRDGDCRQITKDHSLLQMMLDAGELRSDQAASFPYRSVIFRSINPEDRPEPDLVLLDLQAGDRLLLASDGLTDLVPADRIAETVINDDLDAAVDRLVQLALQAGGRDNITCVLGELIEGDPIHPRGQMVGAAGNPRNLIDGAAVRIDRVGSRRTARLQAAASGWAQPWAG